MKKLRDVVPKEFFDNYMGSSAALYLYEDLCHEHDSDIDPRPGPHKHVDVCRELEDGHAVAWVNNPIIGWIFPVVTL